MAKKKQTKKKQTTKMNMGEYVVGHKSLFIIGAMILLLLIALIVGYNYVITNYTVTTVYVEGNIHYTNEEIIGMVMEGSYGDNSLLLSLRYKNKSIEGVPFVEKMDVSVENPHTIKIEVYEKAIAGYVEYLERYMYFDKDGIVVESSKSRTAGVPQVTGLTFDHVVMYEPLPVEDTSIFRSILSITQLVNKYNLSTDRIYFGSDGSLMLYFGDVRASLGMGDYLDEKIMILQDILPKLSGQKGTLRMENYTDDTQNIPFETD